MFPPSSQRNKTKSSPAASVLSLAPAPGSERTEASLMLEHRYEAGQVEVQVGTGGVVDQFNVIMCSNVPLNDVIVVKLSQVKYNIRGY